MTTKQELVEEEIKGAQEYAEIAERAQKEGKIEDAKVLERHAKQEIQHAIEDAELSINGTVKPFNDLEYTRRKIVGQLGLIEEHCTDGSAFQNCKCIEEKHLIKLNALSAEGAVIASEPKEKMFYSWLGPWADKALDHVLAVIERNNEKEELKMWAQLAEDCREIRHSITDGTFTIPNPASKRKFLPHGLTSEEEINEELREKLSSCIKQAEIHCCGSTTNNYKKCQCNPVAICRASVGTGNPKKLSSAEFQRLYDEIRGKVKHPEVQYTYEGEATQPFVLEFPITGKKKK